ncbi:MAG: PQQ-dependent sugar dehydrogenase [Rubrivivax sp.]|nr:MAG: PQQ-dependent sugar dehydrogenase [Rubrivivax sp.]
MKPRRAALVIPLALLLALIAACGGSGDAGTRPTPATPGAILGPPLETREANAPDQVPAFPGQTRAPGILSDVPFRVTVLANTLNTPWAVEPLPDGDLLVTERVGTMRIVSANGTVGPALTGLFLSDARGQGGLLDVALSPTFTTDRTIYWTFTEPRGGANGTSVAKGVLSNDRLHVENAQVIFRSLPAFNGTQHFGSRLAFGPDGKLYVTLGERSVSTMRPLAQQLDNTLGKVLRLNPDGTAPSDNPFAQTADAAPEIWTLGHRNVQAAAFDTQGRLWIVEMGTQGGDELNLIGRGKNYGWPIVAYGEEYSGTPILGALTDRPGYEQSVYYWDPVIAPSGAQFYTGSAFPAWQGSLFIGSLKEKRLVRLVIENDRVVGEEHLLTDRNQRVRDVRQGPDGALYVVTDQLNGELWKITPP